MRERDPKRANGGGRREREDDRSRPGVGGHQRPDAPRRRHLGQSPQLLSPTRPDPEPNRAGRRLSRELGEAPRDLAVHGSVRRKPVGVGRFLRHPRPRPDLEGRASHQRHHVRRHRRLRRPPRGTHPPRSCLPRYGFDCARSLALYFVAFVLFLLPFVG